MPNPTLSAADRPNLIRIEGQTIELTFARTGPTTGRLSWNIPIPAAGCDATTRAYNGIVLVGSTSATTQKNSPVNGQRYTADETLDGDLHAGDTIGGAYVVGAFYDDVETTFVDVSGLTPSTPYFFTAHAVDAVLTYFRAGVHSYSAAIGTGVDTPGAGPAFQGIAMTGLDLAASAATLTGLSPAENYTMSLTLNGKLYSIVIAGVDAQTYSQLEIALNQAIDRVVASVAGYQAPNTGVIYYDGNDLFKWLGNEYAPIKLFLKAGYDPTAPTNGEWWFNSVNKTLFHYETGSWVNKTYITFSADPSQPSCGMYLFNGTTVYKYDGAGWCEAQTFVQATNPFLPASDSCSFNWYNTSNGQLYKRSQGRWVGSPAIYSSVDPNALPDDTYWFNSATSKLARRSSGSWLQVSPLIIAEADDDAVTSPTGGDYWYDPTTQQSKRRTLLNDAWVDLVTITFGQDPATRLSCEDLWWNSATDVLSSWDELNLEWVAVDRFVLQDEDPAATITVDTDAVWVDSDGVLHTWQGVCDSVSVIYWSGGDPSEMGDGTIWYNNATDKFYLRTSGEWVEFIPTRFIANPQTLPLGTFWLNGVMLSQWNGASWIEISYTTTSVTPSNGDTWFNLTDKQLYVWNGRWNVGRGALDVLTYLGPPSAHDQWGEACKSCGTDAPYAGFTDAGFYFLSTATGSDQCLRLVDVSLFTSLTHSGIPLRPVDGADAISALPAYMTEGVGTDGSEEERKLIQRDMILAMGGSGVTLELTKEDLDHSLDRAIRELRRLAAPYTRGYFPVDVTRSDQKRWLLSNKKLGHNKIVRVIGVYRSTGLWMGIQGGGISSVNQPWLYGMMAGKGSGDMLTYHLLASYIAELDTLLARKVTYFFNERSRVLEVHNRLGYGENLLIEASVETPEQELMLDRRYRSWIERWAVAESQMKLAEIRGKYTTLPGPNGGVTLNGAELAQRATDAFIQLRLEVENFIVVDPTEFPGAFFSIG
jgi:hypothetical protein